jgi:hypothetical protein
LGAARRFWQVVETSGAEMTAYSVYLEAGVVEVLAGLKIAERNRILRLLEKLRTDPFLEGDYIESDDIGRPMQVLVVGHHAVVFWADHAVKEVKILDLKPAGN